jgi:cysteine desulfuration protein SufE
MNIQELQDEIIEDFSLFDNANDKYAYIIDLGKSLEDFPEGERKDDLLLKGCQSKVWLLSSFEDGKVIFKADSDAMIVKGLVSLLLKVLSGHSAKEILEADLYFVDKIGLLQMLSMTRSNGLNSMMKQMKLYALAYQKMNA